MKKILSKIFKKDRFFAHLWAERLQCQPPIFGGPHFGHFHKVNDQNWVVQKIGIKGYPLYIQIFWTHFSPLSEGYFLNSQVFKKSEFCTFLNLGVRETKSERFFSGVRKFENLRTPEKNFSDFVHREKISQIQSPVHRDSKTRKSTFFENVGI